MALGTKMAVLGTIFTAMSIPCGIGYLHIDKHLTNKQIEAIHDISLEKFPMDRTYEGYMYDVLISLAGHGETPFFRFPTIVDLSPPSREYLYWGERKLDIHFEQTMPEDVQAFMQIGDDSIHLVLPDMGSGSYHYPRTGLACALAAAAKDYLDTSDVPVTLALNVDGKVLISQTPQASTSGMTIKQGSANSETPAPARSI